MFSAVIIALIKKHPYYPAIDKLLICFDCIIVLLPGLLLGSKLGSFINIMFLQLILILCLTISLSYFVFPSYSKAFEIYEKESRQK